MKRLFKKLILRIFIVLIALTLLAVPALYLIALNSPTVSAAWFNDNWGYRKAVSTTIASNSSDLSNLQMLLTVDTSTGANGIGSGKMQASCQDLRFTNTNGKILPYYIDSGCTTTSTKIWVMVDLVPKNTTTMTLYMYYGNPSAPAGSDSTSTNFNLLKDLKGYWTLNDTSGNRTDSSVSGNTLTDNNTVTSATGQYSNAGQFTAANSEYLSIADNANLSTGDIDFTIATWVYLDSKPAGSSTALAKWGSGDQREYIINHDSSNDRFQFSVSSNGLGGSGTVTLRADNLGSPSTGTWYFVIGWHDSVNNQIGVSVNNGVPDTATHTAGVLDGTGPFELGRNEAGNGLYWNGRVDEVRLYKRVLTATERTQLYTNPGTITTTAVTTSQPTTSIPADYNSRGNNEGVSFSQGDALSTQGVPLKALSNGLVGYWKMDESSWTNDCSTTSVTDSSGNGNNGKSCPNAGGTQPTTGKFGNGGSFDGSNDYVTVPNNATLNLTATITLSAWVNYTSKTGSRRIIVKNQNGVSNGYYLDSDSTNLNFRFYDSGGTLRTAAYPMTNISTGIWYQVLGTYDGSTLKLYVNGVQVATTSYTGTISTNSVSLLIGVSGAGSDNFSGTIDDVKIYNRALSPAEVSALYNFAPGPVGYWSFDEGSGLSAADKSGNGNNGTLTNGPTWTTGKYGKGLNLDGTDDYVGLSNLGISGNTAFTVAMWINSTSSSKVEELFSFGNQCCTNSNFELVRNWPSVGNLTIYNNNTAGLTATFPSNGVWHHVVAGSTASGLFIYIDGVLTASTNSYSITVTNEKYRIGMSGPQNTYYYTGQIDDIRIYNYARTQKQIIEDMGGGHPAVTASSTTLSSSGSTGGSRAGGAVGYWKFDEGYGTTAHNSGSQGETLQGSLSGFASPATTTSGWTQAGKFNRGLNFDGSDDYVDLGQSNSLKFSNSASFAFSAWVNISGVAGSVDASPINRILNIAYACTNGSVTLDVNSSNLPSFSMRDNFANVSTVTGTTVLSTNTWYHLSGVRDAVNRRIYIYVNGALEGSAVDNSTTNLYSSSVANYIGRRFPCANNHFFNGKIDEVKIYPYALTADEVKLDYNRGAAQVLGALSDKTGTGYESKQSANQEYCIPGDSTSCATPVGRWDFDEGAGTSVNDKSGNNNVGTWNGTLGNQWKTGKIGKAGNFNGSNNYVSMGNPTALQITGNITVSAWVKFSASLSGERPFVAKWIGGSGGYYLGSHVTSSNKIWASIYTSGQYSVISNNTYNDGNWHHYSMTYDGSNLRLFIDGKLDGSTAVTGSISNSTDNFSIGAYTGFIQHFPGTIDNVSVFNYARSAAQIAWDYNRGAPVAHWKMDECQGNTAHDSSGNSNHGTLTVGASGTQTSVGTCTGSANTAWKDGATGKFNSSLDFDGTDDYVTIGDVNLLDLTDNFTLSAWVNTASNTTTTNKGILDKGLNGYSLQLIGTDGSPISQNAVALAKSGVEHDVYSSSAIPLNTWVNVVATKNGSTRKIYVNGVDVTVSKSQETYSATTSQLYVGARFLLNADGFITGQIDDVRVYNYALTATQVKLLYNQNSAIRFGPSTGTP